MRHRVLWLPTFRPCHSEVTVLQDSKTPNDTRRARRGYIRPEVRRIDLRGEEVLSVGCKMAGGPGPYGDAGCTAVPCNQPGS